MNITRPDQIETLDFSKGGGLLPVVVQHHATGEVLMLGFADAEAVRRTLESGELWLFSRSRGEYWRKGATSGNVHRALEIHADCDRDALVVLVDPAGPTCHTGRRSCFDAAPTLPRLGDTIAARGTRPDEESYTARLLGDPNLRLKKLGEEAVELALACAAGDPHGTAEEAADLVYHALVACAAVGVPVDAVLARLASRARARGSS